MKNIEYVGLPFAGAKLESVEELACFRFVLSSEGKNHRYPYLLANSGTKLGDSLEFTDAVTGEIHIFYTRHLVSRHPTVLVKAVYDVTSNMAHKDKECSEARLVRFYEPDFKTELEFVDKWLEKVPKSHVKNLDYLVSR